MAGGVRELERYLRAVETDLRRTAEEEFGAMPAADTVYFGGGTPSLLPADSVGRLIDGCRRTFRQHGDAEVTLEMNPASCAPKAARDLLHAGINRISLGVETFDARTLSAVGRLHDAADVRRAVRILREAGLDNLSLDLLAGLPGASVRRFLDDVDAALDLGPEHLSIYMLETDKPTPLARDARRGHVRLPGEDEVAEMFAGGARRVRDAGFQQYEIANFARPGRQSRHNLKYWLDRPVLGVGPSACSYLRGRLTERVRGLGRYVTAVEDGSPTTELDGPPVPMRSAGEAVYLALRVLEGVDLRALSRRYGTDLPARYGAVLERLARDGLVAWEPDESRVRLTSRGALLANEVFAEFAA